MYGERNTFKTQSSLDSNDKFLTKNQKVCMTIKHINCMKFTERVGGGGVYANLV